MHACTYINKDTLIQNTLNGNNKKRSCKSNRNYKSMELVMVAGIRCHEGLDDWHRKGWQAKEILNKVKPHSDWRPL